MPGTAEQNQSVSHAELVEFNCFELIYYILGQSLLQTGVGISWWGNHYYKSKQLRAITKWGKSCYKKGQITYYKLGWSLLQSGGVTTAKWGTFSTKWGSYRKIGQYIDQRYIK